MKRKPNALEQADMIELNNEYESILTWLDLVAYFYKEKDIERMNINAKRARDDVRRLQVELGVCRN